MKQLKIIVLFVLVACGGIQCTTENCAESYDENLYYLEIENLTGGTVQMECYIENEEVFFNLQHGEVKTVFRGIGSRPETGEEGSPLPKNFLVVAYRYDSVVVRAGNRREAFFQSIACSRSDGCDPPVFENSPDWESSWNLLIKDTWELVEEPRSLCEPSGGNWVYRASLRAK